MILNDSLIAGAAEKAFETIKASGVEINVLTEEQKQAFIEKSKPVYDFYIEKGIFTAADLEELRQTIAK